MKRKRGDAESDDEDGKEHEKKTDEGTGDGDGNGDGDGDGGGDGNGDGDDGEAKDKEVGKASCTTSSDTNEVNIRELLALRTPILRRVAPCAARRGRRHLRLKRQVALTAGLVAQLM